MVAAGMAIKKLNAIDRARSFNPTFCTWFLKKTTTSYKGRPWNPGRKMFLLFNDAYR
jgi:hypothetical protein